MQVRAGKLGAVDAAADDGAPQSELFYRRVELLGGEVGISKRNRGERDKAVGRPGADFRQLLVLQLDDCFALASLQLVPEIRVDADCLDVDSLLVHPLDAIRADKQGRRGLL